MDAATIQAKISAGYGKAAQRVGYGFSQYRPTDPLNPIGAPSLVGEANALKAAFTVKATGFNFELPGDHKALLFNGLFDASGVRQGDYLVNSTHGTYFVASLQDLVPPLCVLCSRTVRISKAGPSKSYGVNPPSTYGGTTQGNESAIMAGWPAAILFDARGRAQEVGLPLDLPSPFFVVLLPAFTGLDVRPGNLISDDQGRRYAVQASERGPLGWRIFCQQAVT